jgi:hypothetical protein
MFYPPYYQAKSRWRQQGRNVWKDNILNGYCFVFNRSRIYRTYFKVFLTFCNIESFTFYLFNISDIMCIGVPIWDALCLSHSRNKVCKFFSFTPWLLSHVLLTLIWPLLLPLLHFWMCNCLNLFHYNRIWSIALGSHWSSNIV